MPYLLHFKLGSDYINAHERFVLTQIASYLQEHPTINVRLVGRADKTGSDAINQRLSLARAQQAKEGLLSLGVEESRIEVSALSNNQPLSQDSVIERSVAIYLH